MTERYQALEIGDKLTDCTTISVIYVSNEQYPDGVIAYAGNSLPAEGYASHIEHERLRWDFDKKIKNSDVKGFVLSVSGKTIKSISQGSHTFDDNVSTDVIVRLIKHLISEYGLSVSGEFIDRLRG